MSTGGLRRSSAVRRQSLMAIGDGEDEDARLMRESVNAMRRLNVDETPRARESWINPSAVSTHTAPASTPGPTAPSSNNTTPRARYPATEPQEDSLFDQQTAASANLALQWGEKPSTPVSSGPKNKVMTTAQFERYRQDQERRKRASGGFNAAAASDSDDDAADDTYEDEDDHEEERRREQAKQRRKQEAHMTIYRQQMRKITGENPNPAARPPAVSSQSVPNLQLYADAPGADEEDEDIPLAILAAHGFPNRSRAPGQLGGMSSNPNLRAASQMSSYPPPPRSVTGGAGDRGSALPPFARRLPQDPYFGAGLVNATNRESLALGSGSQYGGGGGPPRAQPGGLVGVIASEERSRALRRGSPNPQGEYPAMPPGMGLGYAGGTRTPSGQPFPTDPAAMQAQMAAMQQQLQQSMEMQFQFFQMMAGGAPGTAPAYPPGMLPPQGMPQGMMMQQGMPTPGGAPQLGGMGRTSTMGSSLGFNAFPSGPSVAGGTQRHTVMAVGGATGAGYAPSIAPSERSNVGMPDRYRPVSQLPAASGADAGGGLRMSGMGGVVKGPVVHVHAVEGEKEEDEEVAWEEMRRQKEKKKGIWRMKKEKKVGLEEVGEMARFTS
jgi:hypothetical protein